MTPIAIVFSLDHVYELEGKEEWKHIGIYSTREKAEDAIARYRRLPGFRDHPDDFHISERELDRDHWTYGFSTLINIQAPTREGVWLTVGAVCLPDGTYVISEKHENHLLGKFKDGDRVRCEERDNDCFAVEKLDPYVWD